MFGKKEGKGSKFRPDGTGKASDGQNALNTGKMGGEGFGSAKGLKSVGFGNGNFGKIAQPGKNKLYDKLR